MIKDYATEYAIKQELGPDERLLWWGKPEGGFALRPNDAFLIPFSLLWGGFAIFWEFQVVNTQNPIFFVIWGIPFVLVGIYLILGRFLVEKKKREATSYALTDRRVMIITRWPKDTVTSINLGSLGGVTLRGDPQGIGSIYFGSDGATPFLGLVTWGTYRSTPHGFEMIQAPREVYNRILEAQKSAQGSKTE